LLAGVACGEEAVVFDGAELAFPGRSGEIIRSTFDTTHGPRELTYELIDGVAVFEGDIILSPEQEIGLSISGLGPKATIRAPGKGRWPAGIVPYTIDPGLTNTTRVTDAIAHWEDNTPVDFVLRRQHQ
jgi:hypothetical protein